MFKVNNGTTKTIFGICLKITEGGFKTWLLFTSNLMTMLLPLTHLNVKELLTRSRRQIWSLSDWMTVTELEHIYIYIYIYIHLYYPYIYLSMYTYNLSIYTCILIYIYLNLIFIYFNIYLNLIYITHIYKCFVYELSGCGFESSCVQ